MAVAAGVWPYRVVLVYGSLAMGTFMVRTMKRVLFQDPHHSELLSFPWQWQWQSDFLAENLTEVTDFLITLLLAGGGSRLNYLLLGLALFQFPFLAWLNTKP